jgi:hypothetical protein
MKNKNKIITTTIIFALLIIGAALVFNNTPFFSNLSPNKEPVKRETPMRVTMEFYNQWLEERKGTTTTPYESGLLQSPSITDEVRSQIERAHKNRKRGDVDPVLCLLKLPNKLDGEEISTTDTKAVVTVKPRDKGITTEQQAVVTLTAVGDQWLITKIDCMVGEMMIEKEYNFEKSGVLLKDSIEPPYNKENWHLVYEQETVPGFVVPLTFDAGSICIQPDKSESPCNATTLAETTKVFVQATMTETGAVVKRMTIE